jgi:hypothetical protein
VITGASSGVIKLALGCNALLAAGMLGAATWTGSSTMLVLAVQFIAAAGCQSLLLYGLRHSANLDQDDRRQSRELHFWNSVVAILLYALAAGVALNEGLNRLAAPKPLTDGTVNFAVLGVAILLIGYTVWNILQATGIQEIPENSTDAIRTVANPVLGLMLIQSFGAVASLLTGLAGISIAVIDETQVADSLAAFTIGLVLAAIAVLAAIQVRSILTDRAGAVLVEQKAASTPESVQPETVPSPEPSDPRAPTSQPLRKNYPPPRKKGGGKHRR